MSFDAGGLAQMTYQSPFHNSSIGTSGPGFASRGKGSHIKRLSVAPPPKISTIDETRQIGNINSATTPRTSRGHLLAGLRTAPKSAIVAPANHRLSLESSKYADPQYDAGSRAPQTAAAAYFPNGRNQNGNYHTYSHPDQILAPPTLDFQGQGQDGIDQDLYDELISTNNYLAQQQRALQQQLLSVTQAAHQFGNLNLNPSSYANGTQQFQSSISDSSMSFYQQQSLQGMQPIVSAVPGNPGVYAVYNPMTGQSSYVVDHSGQQQEQTPQNESFRALSPQGVPNFQRQTSDSSVPRVRSTSPPKSTPSPPQEVEPLPPPSANAFRRGHRKNMSSANIKTTGEWTRTTGPRSAGYPQTPMNGTFAPGHGRAGEHPVRQPKGPPHLQELEEKPTSKHEGSKNFATRQRRRAVHDLVRAGRERRNETRQPPGSGVGTPGSENEFNFSVSSDNDSVLAGSTSLTSKPSLGSLEAVANGHGAIGSERKEKSRERSSVDSTGALSAKSLSSDEGNAIGGPYVEVESARRKTPLLVLSSAEKRKSVVM